MRAWQRIAGPCALGIALAAATPGAADPILGSGFTFAHSLIAAGSKDLIAERAGLGGAVGRYADVDYEAVGSVAGMMRMHQAKVDFAATDAPLPPEALAEQGLAQFPFVAGGIAVVVNLPGIEDGALRLSRAALAGIALGGLTRWSDPAITEANPGLALLDQARHASHAGRRSQYLRVARQAGQIEATVMGIRPQFGVGSVKEAQRCWAAVQVLDDRRRSRHVTEAAGTPTPPSIVCLPIQAGPCQAR